VCVISRNYLYFKLLGDATRTAIYLELFWYKVFGPKLRTTKIVDITGNSQNKHYKKCMRIRKKNYYYELTSHWSLSGISPSEFPSGILTLNSIPCCAFLPIEYKKGPSPFAIKTFYRIRMQNLK